MEACGFPRFDLTFSPHRTRPIRLGFAPHLNPRIVLSRKFFGYLVAAIVTDKTTFEVFGMSNVEAAQGIVKNVDSNDSRRAHWLQR